ncbi:histidine phosphatase family protein [Dictyobacter aurantiacus]|uniref:Alpha-ribazole phosphatase n=1 Tax=Dictyobacter aurantiacus TaxID=1936993 RepID=A0A401Z904_9CHLR|nr:histidine phosphatase family protein [Dictyobacter aurantiacus]GCE03344.1 alpha-ribazole phosphatase [Dictyobacter aurantiacus]
MADQSPLAAVRGTEGTRDEPYVRRLWLVRHGVTDWNSQGRLCGQHDVPLSDVGTSQARWVGIYLCSRPLVALYASDLRRTRQTASILALQLPEPLVVQTSAAWRELSFGAWEGLTYAEVAERYPDQLGFFKQPMQFSPPGGETLAVLQQRVQEGFAQLVQDSLRLPSGELALVSHAGPLRVLLCSLLGIPFERQWQLQFAHGSISAIDFVAEARDVPATTTLALLNYHQTEIHIDIENKRMEKR